MTSERLPTSQTIRPAILGPIHLPGLYEHLYSKSSTGTLPTGMGGYCINDLVDARLRLQWKTDVITLDPNISEDIVRFDGPLLRLWVVRRRKSGAIRDLFSHERRLLLKAVEEAKPTLLHAHWTYEYGMAVARQTQYRYVVTVHDHARHCLRWIGWRYVPLYLMSQYVLRKSHHLTAVSPYISDYLKQRLQRTVPVIPNLIPARTGGLGQNRKQEHIPVTSVHIVSAINWSRLKNTRNALLAIKIARKACASQSIDLVYTLLGPELNPGGPAEHWAIQHDCAQGVVFKGVVPHTQALEEIAKADILFHPSHEESFGCSVSEAMAIGVPIVACREAAGSRWLCGDNRGRLCDGYSPEAMAGALLDAIRHPSADAIHSGKTWIQALTEPKRLLEEYNTIYRKALGA